MQALRHRLARFRAWKKVKRPRCRKLLQESSKRAAVVRRGADREKRDLFAPGPLDIGSVKPNELRPAPYASADGIRGAGSRRRTQRNLGALHGRFASRLRPHENTSIRLARDRRGTNEGRLGHHRSQGPLVGAAHRGARRSVAPLFSEPPPAAFARDAGRARISRRLLEPSPNDSRGAAVSSASSRRVSSRSRCSASESPSHSKARSPLLARPRSSPRALLRRRSSSRRCRLPSPPLSHRTTTVTRRPRARNRRSRKPALDPRRMRAAGRPTPRSCRRRSRYRRPIRAAATATSIA